MLPSKPTSEGGPPAVVRMTVRFDGFGVVSVQLVYVVPGLRHMNKSKVKNDDGRAIITLLCKLYTDESIIGIFQTFFRRGWTNQFRAERRRRKGARRRQAG